MNIGAGHGAGRYALAFRVGFHVILVPVMGLIAFLRPPGVGVLLTQFVSVFFRFPLLGDFPGLDAGVFLASVALARGIHECCVHDGTGASYEVRGIQLPGKSGEKFPHDIRLDKIVPEEPDGLGIGNAVFQVEPQEPHETPAVIDPELGLIVTEVIDALQDEDFEHEQTIVRRTTACTFWLFVKCLSSTGRKISHWITLLRRTRESPDRLSFSIRSSSSKSPICILYHSVDLMMSL